MNKENIDSKKYTYIFYWSLTFIKWFKVIFSHLL